MPRPLEQEPKGSSSRTSAGIQLQQLERFKDYVNKEFPEFCKEKFGDGVYRNYIYPCMDDMLLSLEAHCEVLAEATAVEDLEDYANNTEERIYEDDDDTPETIDELSE